MNDSRVRLAAVLAVLSTALYLIALHNGFAYDDVAVIQLDTRIHSLDGWFSIFTRGYWADAELALYRPLTTMSFAVDWAISGGRPAWFLFVNALWNTAACVLAFLLLCRFVRPLVAFGAALIFAAHPVHVEAVANVVGRAELGAAAFMLACLLMWPRTGAARHWPRVAAVAVLFALALLMKESAIMLPAMLVLLDAATGDLRPHNMRDWLRSRVAPLAAVSAVAILYLALRVAVLGGVAPDRLDAALEVTAGSDRLLTALQAWPVYLRLLVMPTVLLADYGPHVIMPARGVTLMALAGALILLALIVGGVVAWRRGHGPAALALLWFPVAILPVSNLIIPIGIIVAERTLYLPSFALALGIALISQDLHATTRFRAAAAAAIIVVAALFATRTLIRIPEWKSTDTIFAALLRDRPDSFRAHWHHARIAAAARQHDVALARYVRALELWPFRKRLVLETVRAAPRAGQLPYARDIARYAHTRWPADPDAARLLAAATIDLGDTIAARAIIDSALLRIPGDSLLLRMRSAISTGTDE
jgi:tetratricopeptide (TPR) repeat protein